MREPTRWKDTTDAPAGARELLRRAPRTPALRAEDKMRSAMRLAAFATVPLAAGAWLWVASVALAATVGIGATVIVAGHVFPSPPAPRALPPAPSSLTMPSRAGPGAGSATSGGADDRAPPPGVAPAADSAPSPSPTTPRPLPAPSSANPEIEASRGPTPPPLDDSLAREAAVLEQARSLLAQDPGAALALLSRSGPGYPRAQLGIERELLSVDALRRLGRTSEARARGERLLRTVRGTLYEERVRRLLAGLR